MPLGVIPDEHNLGTYLQGKERLRRITVLGEISLYHSLERRGFAGEHRQPGIIDFIGLRIMRCKTYNIIIGRKRAYTGIKFLEHRLCHPVFPDGIQYLKEIIILLPMHLLQLYYYVVQFLQSLGMKEIRCRIDPLHILALAFLHHRGELVHITNHKELHPAEGLVVTAEKPEGHIHCIKDIGPHHRNLVNDKQVESPEYL